MLAIRPSWVCMPVLTTTPAAPIADHRAHEGGILAVTQGNIPVQHQGGVFLHRHGFASERGFFHLHVNRLQQAHIRRDEIAGFQKDNIPGTSSRPARAPAGHPESHWPPARPAS